MTGSAGEAARHEEGSGTSLLLTGAGGAGTIEILRTLREIGGYRLIALDASPYAYGLGMADRAYRVPFAREPGFEPALEAILRRERPDFLLPLVDEEIPVFQRMAVRLGGTVLAPSPAFTAVAMDKWLTFRELRARGLPVPDTWLADAVADDAFPAIVKPRAGRGSRGLAYLDGRRDLEQYLAGAAGPAGGFVVQRRMSGVEFTCSVVVSLSGEVLSVVPKEVLLKQGITQAAVTRVSPAIDAVCRGIQAALRADGPFNVQVMLDADGTPRVIEVNPRYSTTVALTIAAGVHEVDWVVRHARGEPVEPRDFVPDLMMVRHVTQDYLPESEWREAPLAPAGAGE